MKSIDRGLRLIAIAGAIVTVFSAVAQSNDPFQSNPGPPPAPRPAPHHAPRHPAPEAGPEPVSPPPAPVVVAPPPPDPAKRFDGLWEGAYACGPGHNQPAIQIPRAAQVRDGQFRMLSGVAPGTPGYWRLTGAIGPDGHVALTGESVGTGRIGSSLAPGERLERRFSGRFDGDRFTATDEVTPIARGCGLSLTRRR